MLFNKIEKSEEIWAGNGHGSCSIDFNKRLIFHRSCAYWQTVVDFAKFFGLPATNRVVPGVAGGNLQEIAI